MPVLSERLPLSRQPACSSALEMGLEAGFGEPVKAEPAPWG